MLMFQETSGAKSEGTGGAITEDRGAVLSESYGDAFKKGVGDALGWFANELKEVLSPKQILIDRPAFLDQEQAKIRASLGLGSQKANEFKKLVADGASKFAEIGLEVDKVGDTYRDLVSVFKTEVSLSNEDLLQLAATAKVTGVETKLLAGGFRGVGISIQEVGENMAEVTKIARQTGVSVAAVSADVVANLDKMNIYNFENGVKGLAKMAAQSNKLGITMDNIFTVVEKAFNPESAIEMAAAMQRLGVSTGALLDPLRLMDLAQNDPTEFTNQLANMSKEFVRFNKDLGQFEIMPGEKRRLNEIAKELGITNGELQKMAINAAGLDMKMKQIRFPSSIASKEDRELIATLASVNKLGVSEIKVATFDEKGDATGEYDMVEVSKLSVEQLGAIKKDQELRGRSMEEIAIDQLSELQTLSTQFDAIAKGFAYGVSSRSDVSTPYELATKGFSDLLFGNKIDKKEGKIGGKLPKSARAYREIDMNDIIDLKDKLFNDAGTLFTTISSAFDFTNIDLTKISEIGDSIKKMYDDIKKAITGNNTQTSSINQTQLALTNQNAMLNTMSSPQNQIITNQNLNQSISSMSFDPIKIEQETVVVVKFEDATNGKLQPNSNFTAEIENWFQQPTNQNLVVNKIKEASTNNNLTEKK